MSKLLVTAGWNHVPHLDEEAKARLLEAYPAHEREARINGVPLLGSGLIFPTDEREITCNPFNIPAYWPRINGIDFGWDHPTGAASLAWDRDNDCVYVVNNYSAKNAVPVMTVASIKPWGSWIPTAWPHDGLQHDKGSGEQLAEQYKKHGLVMLRDKASHQPQRGESEGSGGNSVEAGLQDMQERMMTGRWKVWRTCELWLEEKRTYHRKDGKVVKLRDDVISASRYAYMMIRHAKIKPVDNARPVIMPFRPSDRSIGL